MAVVKQRKPRIKTGLGAAPIEKGFYTVQQFFHYDVEDKEVKDVVDSYVRTNYLKKTASGILSNPSYKLYANTSMVAAIFWMEKEQEFPETYKRYPSHIKEYFDELASMVKEEKEETKVVRLSPQQLMVRKINNTVMYDIDKLEDQWYEGEKTDLNMYDLFREYDLKAAAVPYVQTYVQTIREEYNSPEEFDLPKTEITRRAKVLDKILSDLESIALEGKQTRKTTSRVKKPRAADKQVAKVQYKPSDITFKISSVSPVNIVGATSLYVFNTKTRKLTYYFTESTGGFEVSGTSIKNFDPEQSFTLTLRQNLCDSVIKTVLKKTLRQSLKSINELSSKKSVPNGRLNSDTVILRTI